MHILVLHRPDSDALGAKGEFADNTARSLHIGVQNHIIAARMTTFQGARHANGRIDAEHRFRAALWHSVPSIGDFTAA